MEVFELSLEGIYCVSIVSRHVFNLLSKIKFCDYYRPLQTMAMERYFIVKTSENRWIMPGDGPYILQSCTDSNTKVCFTGFVYIRITKRTTWSPDYISIHTVIRWRSYRSQEFGVVLLIILQFWYSTCRICPIWHLNPDLSIFLSREFTHILYSDDTSIFCFQIFDFKASAEVLSRRPW